MSDIGDLFGEYATPFKKKILEELAKKQESQPNSPKPRHVTHICSHCGSQQAWYSSDHGATWQCFNHKN